MTVSLNEASHIEKTILSVKNQTYKDIEHIFIDGESTDGTLDIIRKYATPVITPPQGIYQAMNIGTDLVTGDYVLYLNANDWLVNNTVIAEVVEFIQANEGADLYFGRKRNYDCSFKFKNIPNPYQKTAPRMTNLGKFIPHPASFFNVEWMLTHRYREDLKICSDRFFISDICLYGKVLDIGILTTNYYQCGLSFLDNRQRSMEFTEYKKTYLSIVDKLGGINFYK